MKSLGVGEGFDVSSGLVCGGTVSSLLSLSVSSCKEENWFLFVSVDGFAFGANGVKLYWTLPLELVSMMVMCSERFGMKEVNVWIQSSTVASGLPTITYARKSKSRFSRMLCLSIKSLQRMYHASSLGVLLMLTYVVTYSLMVRQRLKQRLRPTHAPVMVSLLQR